MFTRKIAILFAAILALCGFRGGLTTDQPIPIRAIANGGYVPSMVDNTNVQANGSFCRYARISGTKFRIVITNWYVVQGGAETNSGGTLTISAGANAGANSLTRVSWTGEGGTSTGLVAADGATVVSDDISQTYSAGDLLCARCLCTASVGRVFGINNLTTALGDALNVAPSGLSDLSLGGTITNNSGTNFFSVFFVGPSSSPAAAIIADSIGHGTGDTVDSTGDMGSIARSLGPTIPYLNLAVGADQAHLFVLSHGKRADLIRRFTTTLVNGLGRNDLNSSRSSAQLAADMQTITGYFPKLTSIITTLAPTSSSSDSWATTVNQTTAGTNSVLTTYNTAVRAGTAVPSATHFSEINGVMATTLTSGIWNVTGSAFGYTTDGVHPTHSMNLLIVGTTNPAWIQ